MQPCGAAEQNIIKVEDCHPPLNLFVLKVFGYNEMDAPRSLHVGMGDGGGPSDSQTVGVGGVSVLLSLWDWTRSLSFSPQAHILSPQ